MVGIWQYPDLPEIENFISQGVLQAAEAVSEQERPIAPYISGLSLRKILIIEEWGEGEAEYGEDALRVVVFFEFQGPDDAKNDAVDAVIARFSDDISEGRINVPTELRQAMTGISASGTLYENFNETLISMNSAGMNMVFDLTELEAIQLIEGRPPTEYPRIPLEELVRDEEDEETEDEEDADEEEPTPLDISDVSPLPEDMLPDIPEGDVGPEFPEINENVRAFAVSEDTLEVPAGKEEKEIDVREPYDFEIEMALPGIQTRSEIFRATTEEIAQPVGSGTLGETEPVGTYPRTGIYIRNYLKFRGPAYSYEMYKNLVYYSAYISGLHDINVKAGSYQSFREYMYVLEEIPERGGPRLIEGLSQQQAAAQGLETIPDHPSIEGEKAPWLEGRQYYEIVEGNDDHEAWLNAFGYLHGEVDEQ